MKIYFKIGLFFLLLPIHSQDIGFSNVLKEVYPDKNEFNYPKNYKVNTARNSYSDVNIIIKTNVGDKIDFNHPNRRGHEALARQISDERLCF